MDLSISVIILGRVGAYMANNHQQEDHHHIIPFSILRNVCAALLVLTVLTVVCARINFGVMAAPVAFLIAITKAMLVMSYFMGLKYDAKSNRVIFGLGFFFLAVLLFFCALDIWTRIGQMSTL